MKKQISIFLSICCALLCLTFSACTIKAEKKNFYAVYGISDYETDRTDLDSRLDATASQLTLIVRKIGYEGAFVTREGDVGIRVEVPSVSNPDKLFNLMGSPADIIFKLFDSDQKELQVIDVVGKNVKNATVGLRDSQYVISIEFDSKGADEFAAITSANIGNYIQILVDNDFVTMAKINETITDGRTFIGGNFTRDAAKDLALRILAGAFDVKLKLIGSGKL